VQLNKISQDHRKKKNCSFIEIGIMGNDRYKQMKTWLLKMM